MKNIIISSIIPIIIILHLTPQICFSHGGDGIAPFLLNGYVGYQYGVGTNGYISSGFDANVVLILLNGGFSYKNDFGSNAYIGFGFASLIQIQYGYAYTQQKNLMRIRTDIPFHFMPGKGLWRTLAINLYWEKRFDDEKYTNNYGLGVSIGIMNLILCPEGR